MAQTFGSLALSITVLTGLTLGTVNRAGAEGVLLVEDAARAETIAQTASASDGQRLHSEPGRYSVQVPVSLQAAAKTTAISGTTLDWTIDQASQGGTFYAVAYTDLPLELLALGQAAVVESLTSSPLTEGVNWQAIANRGQRVTLGDLAGMEYLHLAEGQVSAVRFYLANRRLYAVMASSPDLQAANQFLDSFAIDSLWRPFVSEEGRFSVDLPMAPVATPQQVSYQGTLLNWWQFVGYNLHAPGDRYGFAYVDLPPSVSSSNADAVLADVATQVLTELQVPELTMTGTVIALEGHPGRQYLLTHANGQSYVMRLYLVDRRIYGLLAASKSLNHLNQFLTSFEVQ
jgi:hypothetical protein